jgi:hypothetical protein
MSTRVIKRYFSEDIFDEIKSNFGFLIANIIRSGFEYDLQIRDNYFNLYYKGNSLGKIKYNKRNKLYTVNIHSKFVSDKIKARFNAQERKADSYLRFSLSLEQLKSLYGSKNLLSIARKVKDVNYQEEISFEQMLITDNVNRSDLIIIDRQIREKNTGTKIDLLALKQTKGNSYQFCVIEVKLGNNPELKGKVVGQLKGYMKRISDNFPAYKKCYELNLKQKQQLGLIDKNLTVNIVKGIWGVVVVGGYSGIAEERIKELKKLKQKQHPDIMILPLKNIIDFSRVI